MTELDYFKLKEAFLKSGNQKNLDTLIYKFIQAGFCYNKDFTYFKNFFKGLTIHADILKKLSMNELFALAFCEITNREEVIHHLLEQPISSRQFSQLYEEGLIKSDIFLDRILRENNFDWYVVVFEHYHEGLDYRKIEEAFLKFLKSHDDAKEEIEDILIHIPYNEKHLELANCLLKNRMVASGKGIISHFINQDVKKDISFVDLLETRPDLLLLVKAYISEMSLGHLEEKLFNGIEDGQETRVAFCMEVFPQLKAFINIIINDWGETDVERLNLYFDYLVNSDLTYLPVGKELDQKNAALKKKETEDITRK